VLQERRSRENAEQENVLATVGGAPGAPGTLAQQHVARADRSDSGRWLKVLPREAQLVRVKLKKSELVPLTSALDLRTLRFRRESPT